MECKVFLDTNVIADMYFQRNVQTSLQLKKLLKSSEIECISSIDIQIEFFNLLKENAYIKRETNLNESLDVIIRKRNEKKFNADEKKVLAVKFEDFLNDYNFIKFVQFEKIEDWQLALGLLLRTISESDIPTNDVMNFVVAWLTECSYFITRDEFLISTGKEYRETIIRGADEEAKKKIDKRLIDFLKPEGLISILAPK